MILKRETPDNIEAINEVKIVAFKNHLISPQTEQFIIEALRYANSLTISLVAEIDGHIVGNIAFSPVVISNGTKGRYGYQEIMV